MTSVGIARETALSPGETGESASALSSLGKDQRLNVITREPLNVETPLALLDAPCTPVERLFLRNHQPLVVASAAEWELTIDGLVRRPLTLSFGELLKLPRSCYAAVLECSGNGRNAFAEAGTPAEGLPLTS